MSKGLWIGLVLIVVLIAGIILSSVLKNNDIAEISKNPQYTVAKITGHGIPKKSSDTHYGVWLEYEYQVDGKQFQHSSKYYFPEADETYFQGKYFPLIYNALDPDMNQILILKEDFDEFSMAQPDSLAQYNGKIY